MTEPHPFDASGSVPDVNLFFEQFARESAQARAEHNVIRNIAYGETPIETFDFFSAGARAPLAVFFHGGYWRRMDKDDFSFIARGLVPLGISVASINYGLAPQIRLREMVAQCRRALKWIRANDEELGVDPEGVSVLGHSAGAHLAAMTAVDAPVRSVVGISGLYDLGPIRAFTNDWLGLSDEDVATLSPVHQKPAQRFPMYVTAGEHESDAFKAQSHAIVDAWRPHGCAAEYADSSDDNHFTIMLRLMNPADPLTQMVAQLAR